MAPAAREPRAVSGKGEELPVGAWAPGRRVSRELRFMSNEPEINTEETIDLREVDEIVDRIGRAPEAVIPILQAIQARYRYLPRAALWRVCQITEITPAQITGVATFYTQFRHDPVGEHTISVCHGTACHVKGAEQVTAALRRHLRITSGQDTDPQGLFTIQKVNCLGCCTLAPVLQIDGITYGHQSPDTVGETIQDFLELKRRGLLLPPVTDRVQPRPGLAEIRVGIGSCCVAGGSLQVREALEQAVREVGAPAVVKPVGCVGMCHRTPMVEIVKPGEPPHLYAKVTADQAGDIVRRHFPPRAVGRRVVTAISTAVERLLDDEAWQPVTRYAVDVRDQPVCGFLGPQVRIATEHSGALDPFSLEEYLRTGGFAALRRCLHERTPEEVIDEVKSSGLRGRGGAGFPTGRKWELVRAQPSQPKYVLCNGDEGDPGAFMDRMILESYPFRVLEGLAIAAWAVGAHDAIFYIRAEYPLAVARTWQAIEACEQEGIIGANCLGSGYELRVSIREGAGAFVCGEETGLIASMEGRRGMPRLRPPYPAEKGLWGQPTLINNVETLAVVPWILNHGASAFAALGTESSKGTKVFALAGKVRYGGLIEVPMGVTIRQIVEEIGGGVAEGRSFKAVQIGGPSGGCIPAALSDIPVDYEALTAAGAIMGSGGLVVLDDRDCMVDVARYFLDFTEHESCGRCTSCRVGTRRMLEILERLTVGEGRAEELEELERLGQMIKRTSICGLGQTAPNPVLTTLRYFREEYEAHVAGQCPAHRCPALIKYVVNDQCIGCTRCAQSCPVGAIELRPYQKHEIEVNKCIRCGTCPRVCPVQAVEVRTPVAD